MFRRAPALPDRRDFPRSDLSSDAELQTPSGARPGELTNLSRSGAQIEVAKPPAIGTPALIKWDGGEALGQIVWSRGNSCGIRFDRLLPEDAIQHSVEAAVRRTGPAAALGNIAVGRRRSFPGRA
jgi:hypothetical protein